MKIKGTIYINLCIEQNLSKREAIQVIKNNTYERLLAKPEHIEINTVTDKKYEIREHLKNPIIIKLDKEDKAQIEFYMWLVNKNLKRSFHNRTIGIIISKRQDELIVSYVSSDVIIPITYAIKT